MQLVDLLPTTIISALIGGLLGALINHWLTLVRERAKAKQTRERHLCALSAEIEYCAKLASTYRKGPFTAPLYRFPSTVYKTVYPTLVSEILKEDDVLALTVFYSQVEQMNRGLDAVDRYRASKDMELVAKEIERLLAKADEMKHPKAALGTPAESEFYAGAAAAIKRHFPG